MSLFHGGVLLLERTCLEFFSPEFFSPPNDSRLGNKHKRQMKRRWGVLCSHPKGSQLDKWMDGWMGLGSQQQPDGIHRFVDPVNFQGFPSEFKRGSLS